MDFQTGIRTRLLANPAVSAAVATRVDWGMRPQGAPFPAIVLQTLDDPRPVHLKGYQNVRSTLVQMDVYAVTYASALTIARAAIDALKAHVTISGKVFAACFVERQRDFVDDTGTQRLHRQLVDFNVWHEGV
jgi:Protein of unknown function (DUF3168)